MKVVHVAEAATDEQQAVHPVVGAQRSRHGVLEPAPGGVGVQLLTAAGAGAGAQRAGGGGQAEEPVVVVRVVEREP